MSNSQNEGEHPPSGSPQPGGPPEGGGARSHPSESATFPTLPGLLHAFEVVVGLFASEDEETKFK